MQTEAEMLEEVEAYFRNNPESLAANVKPLVMRAGAGWQIIFGRENPGAIIVAWTLKSAFAAWEANYREATQAQQ